MPVISRVVVVLAACLAASPLATLALPPQPQNDTATTPTAATPTSTPTSAPGNATLKQNAIGTPSVVDAVETTVLPDRDAVDTTTTPPATTLQPATVPTSVPTTPQNTTTIPTTITTTPNITTITTTTTTTTTTTPTTTPTTSPPTPTSITTTTTTSTTTTPQTNTTDTPIPDPSTSSPLPPLSTDSSPSTTMTTTASPGHHTGASVAISLFILVTVILVVGASVWWVRRRWQLERLRHQLMPVYNFDPTDDVDDWENQLLEEERSLRPEADKVQLYSGNATFEASQKTPGTAPQKE